MYSGFVDLRLNRQHGPGNDSFWPSFTDIMTVIVMIFLITMVVLLMRNMELVSQLRTTMEAERAASELARATGRQADSLALDLHRQEERVAQLQMQVMRLQEENARRQTLIDQRNQRIAALSGELTDLTQQSAQLILARQEAENQRDQANNKVQQQDRALAELRKQRQQQQETEKELQQRVQELLAGINQQRQRENQALQQQQQVEKKYLLLADEFDDLKARYDKLIRPARSPKGRHLVEVRYGKKADQYRISWRQGGKGAFTTISRSELDRKLAQLKTAHPDGLYVKIIFPENSGLSFNEAWEFTNHLHQNYDYYYQQ